MVMLSASPCSRRPGCCSARRRCTRTSPPQREPQRAHCVHRPGRSDERPPRREAVAERDRPVAAVAHVERRGPAPPRRHVGGGRRRDRHAGARQVEVRIDRHRHRQLRLLVHAVLRVRGRRECQQRGRGECARTSPRNLPTRGRAGPTSAPRVPARRLVGRYIPRRHPIRRRRICRHQVTTRKRQRPPRGGNGPPSP